MTIARVNRKVRQPQYPVTVDTANPITRGLVRALVCDGAGIRDLILGTGVDVTGTYIPQATESGYGLRNNTITRANYTLVGARTETVSAITIVWAGVVHRIGGTTYPFFRNAQTIVQATGTTGPLWSARFGVSTTVNSTTPIKIGSPTTYVYRKAGAIGSLFVDGVPALLNITGGTGAHSTAHSIDGNAGFAQSNDITTNVMLIYDRPLSDAESRALSINPWQVFRPVQRRIYFDMGAGGSTDITLLGTNGTQSNIAALDTIVQSHYLISASDKQDTTGSIGPVTLSQSLSVTSSESRNTTSSGTVYQTHALLATQANQKNVGAGGSVILEQTFSAQSTSSATTSTASAISQIHAIVGQATTQSNVSLTPSISQVGSFVAVSAQQTSLSSPASISQAQTISATQSNQAQVISTGQISLTQALTVVAANQSNIAPPVVIVQGNVSAAASGVQNNTTSLGTITQTQTLVGESSQSTNVGSTATISQTIDLSAVAANQHAIGDSNTIWQAQFVQSQTVTQANAASVGAISAVPVIWLNAAISDQVSTSPAASITQDHNFAVIGGKASNSSIAGIITQIHEAYASASNQSAISIAGQVAVIDYSQTPSIFTATSSLIRYTVDSPEIPYAVDSPQIVYQVFATK